MTATQPDSDERTISRRGVMRATAIGVGAAGSGAIGTRYATGSVAAADWNNVAKSFVIGGPIGLLAFGDILEGPDDSAVADAMDWEAHVSEYTRAREDNLALEQTLASLSRDVQLVGNKAREQAIFKIYEQAVDSGTEADATAAAETAINETFAVVEKAIYQSWDIRARRYFNVAKMFIDGGSKVVSDNPELEAVRPDGSIITGYNNSGAYSTLQNSGSIVTKTVNLLDGSSLTYAGGSYSNDSADLATAVDIDPRSSDLISNPPSYELVTGAAISKPDPANYDSVSEDPGLSGENAVALNAAPFYNIVSDLYDEHSTLISEVSAMVSSYFTPAQEGNLDLNSALGPAYLSETAKNAQDFEEAALAMRSLGYPISDQALVFSFDEYPDEMFDARLAWTAHNGDTLPVGETIQPSNTVGSIFAAANNTPEGSDQTGGTFEVTEPFTILETNDGSTRVSFEDRSLAESGTSAEEVEQIFRENYDANQKATETVYETATSSGGGSGGAGAGFFSGDGPSTGAIAAAVGGIGVVYALFGQGDS